MKAKYILDALETMKQAEQLLDSSRFETDPKARGTVSYNLTRARIALQVYSGIDGLEVNVELK